ncbi:MULTISPECIES: hypothetical protein [Pseudomonas]|uniref:hypothetical protein n=1 Tax=Pseudomonas TaxID=286 RepID=UPI0025B19487|nr:MULTISPECIES: hypothetical protein [Pseudomonas]MDN3237001.1 hypothetical protein [Pseudomonas sp. WAC2]
MGAQSSGRRDQLQEKHQKVLILKEAGHGEVLSNALRVYNLPFDAPGFKVTLHWHERSDTSVALRWFLELVAEAITQSRP